MPRKYSNTLDADRAVRRIRWLAYLLDGAFQVPGTRLRVGLDPIIGLVPVGGDLLTALLSLYIVYEGWRLGVDRSTLAKMLVNVAVDTAIGFVPAVGDVFDAAFQANIRNMELMGLGLPQPPSHHAVPR